MDQEDIEPSQVARSTPPDGEPVRPAPAPVRARGRYVPAILDAIIPGLGHLAAGRRKRAILFLTPVIIAAVVSLWIVLTTSTARLAGELLASEAIWGLLGIQGLLLIWRLLAVGSSLWNPSLPRPGRRDVIPIAILIMLIVAPQAYGGYATETAREAADEVFVEATPAPTGPLATPESDPQNIESAPPDASLDPSLAPSPSATPVTPRITGLIVGVDSGVGRTTYLTDTMIVVSVDPVTESVSLVSIPRDMVDVPLGDGRKFRGKINSLVAYARHNPKVFPGSDGTGFDVLMDALGTLLKEPIQYYAAVNLGGFVNVVNTLGGVNVNVVRGFCDPHYKEYGYDHGFSITAGRHHLNGNQALAYARVRKPLGESDFTRAARQQEVVSGVRDAIVRGDFLNDPIGLIKALGQTVQTNVPRKALPDLADLASRINRKDTYRVVIDHPLVRGRLDNRGSIQVPNLSAIRKLAAAMFPTPGTLPPGKYLSAEKSGPVNGSGTGSCQPAATPKPTVKPTPKPSPKATTKPTPGPSPTPSPTPASLEPSTSTP